MKKIIFIYILIFSFVLKIEATTYTTVNKELLNYEINNFYIENDNLIINGWAILDNDVQHFLDSSTHSYSLYIENIYNTSDNHLYSGNILPADKTSMYKYTTTVDMCPLDSIYNDAYSCYTKYENVGFEFTIPLSDLNVNSEYQIYLRVNGKTANLFYEIVVYAPNLNTSHIKDGVEYKFISDFSTVDLTVISKNLFVRSGPDINLNEVHGSYTSCAYGTRLYWGEYKTFSTLQEIYQLSTNYDSDTWFRLLYNEGLCQSDRSRAIMGYSYSGWIASVHTDFSGTPATIKTILLENLGVGDIVTYTNNVGNDSKISLELENNINQTINVKIYYDDILVVDTNETFIGNVKFEYYFELVDSEKIKIFLKEENDFEHYYETEIYVSSNETFYINNESEIVNPSTPIIVIKNGNRINYIYEEIKATIPYNYIKLSLGSPLYAWLLLDYSSTNNLMKINSDITTYAKFLYAEDTLNLNLSTDNMFVINYDNTEYTNYQMLFDVPNMYLSNPQGNIFTYNDPLYIDGGRKWYTPINGIFGIHNYNIIASNVGVNSVTIIFNCFYESLNSIYGNNESEFVLYRVEVPDTLNYFLNKSYDFVDLTFYKERLNL